MVMIFSAPGGGEGVVSGLIVMWHDTIGNIPSGYVICDGENSTPNLLTKFVQGVSAADTNPGDTGGAATHALSEAELAIHHHHLGVQTTGAYSKSGGSATIIDAARYTDEAGSDSAHENEPTFYDVAFLMKT